MDDNPNDRPADEAIDKQDIGRLLDESDAEEIRRTSLTTLFAKEVFVLFIGVAIGFFWSEYSDVVSQEAHLIVFLSIVVLCLVRYIYLIIRFRRPG